MTLKIGVVLSGSGVHDGAEIQEAVSILIAIDQQRAEAICMAPNKPQRQTINHLTNEASQETRNVLTESARIARGNIRDIAAVHADELDALIFPGGFGAAKNLCTFFFDGPGCQVDEQVAALLRAMHAAKKPIGLACIAPVIAAKVLGESGHTPGVTIGTDGGVTSAINAMGGEHHDTGPTDIYVDTKNRLVTTPCYMNEVTPRIVFEGARKMVQEVIRMASVDASV